MKRFWERAGFAGIVPMIIIAMTGCNTMTDKKGVAVPSVHEGTNGSAGASEGTGTNGSASTNEEGASATPSTASDPASTLTNEQMLEQIKKTNFMGPSDGPYPNLKQVKNLWIDVDITKQRVYIKDGDQTIYTMLTSSGLDNIPDNSTPRGTFYTEAEKGLSFYTPKYSEGAKYWSSWKDHGVFLFHSVVTDEKGNIKQEEAGKLGQKASHGCFRLPVLDAKWIYENIPPHTKVVIHD